MNQIQERGAKDYLKRACITMREFQTILLICIIFYNSKRVIKDFPYDEQMLQNNVQPHSKTIWKYGLTLPGANLISMDDEKLILTLLPRSKGKFNRFGLHVNKMRYHNSNFTEQYLSGGEAVVAYNPEDVSKVWLINRERYIRFDLIETRYTGKMLVQVNEEKEQQKKIISAAMEEKVQAELDLAGHIQAITAYTSGSPDKKTKNIRTIRKKEVLKNHRNIEGEVIRMETLLNQIPRMMAGSELKEAMTYLPDYEVGIRNADAATRLLSLSDVYQIYIPTNMSIEIYSKLYLTMIRSLQKKNSIESTMQLTKNYKAMHGAPYVGINGGDSFTVIGTSGLGKTSSFERSLSLVDANRLIDLETPSFQSKVIKILTTQCPHDCSCRGMLLELLRQADMILGSSNYYERAIKSKATVDMLIGTVCQLAVKSIAVVIIDEIQNLVEHKGGQKLMAMLTQLINCGNVSICMVGTPESITFFESDLRLARRSTGMIYEGLPYNQNFIDLCKTIYLYQYQYVNNPSELTDGIILWLYEHSAGIISNVISLFHDAQEIAILNKSETLNIEVLNAAFTQRMSMLNSYIAPFVRKNSQTSRVSKKKIEELPKAQEETVVEAQDVYKLIIEARRTDNNAINVLKEAGYIIEVAI